MKIAAAQGIASIIKPSELGAEYIIPSVFDKRVVEAVAEGRVARGRADGRGAAAAGDTRRASQRRRLSIRSRRVDRAEADSDQREPASRTVRGGGPYEAGEVFLDHPVRGEALHRHPDRGAHHRGPARLDRRRRAGPRPPACRRGDAGRARPARGPRPRASPMAQPVTPCSQPSGHQPSRTERFSTPFIAAFMPEVPLASSGRRGVLSHTSQPRVRSRAEPHVVVLEEDDALGPLADRLDQQRDDGLARLVRGVRLAGEDELHAPVLEEGRQAIGVAQEQVGALVGRRPPREADGQGASGRAARPCAPRPRRAARPSARGACACRAASLSRAAAIRGSCQVPTCTPLVIAMIGARVGRRAPTWRARSRRAAADTALAQARRAAARPRSC